MRTCEELLAACGSMIGETIVRARAERSGLFDASAGFRRVTLEFASDTRIEVATVEIPLNPYETYHLTLRPASDAICDELVACIGRIDTVNVVVAEQWFERVDQAPGVIGNNPHELMEGPVSPEEARHDGSVVGPTAIAVNLTDRSEPLVFAVSDYGDLVTLSIRREAYWEASEGLTIVRLGGS